VNGDAVDGRVRVGVLGAARIAEAFVAAVRGSTALEVTAIASRDADRAARFAQTHGIARALGSYEALLADPAIDAIYNPLPNALHGPWSIRAADAGKHVLCEKPLAATAALAEAMFAAAARNRVVLVEAFPYRAQPHAARLRELVAGGAIGRPTLVHASFGFPLTRLDDVRLEPALGGGALYDLGTYCVSLVNLIAPGRPARVQAFADWHPSGVDRAVVASLAFASGLLAQISCSFDTTVHRHARITGTEGTLDTGFPNNPPLDHPVVLELRRGATREAIEVAPLSGLRAEAESFAAAIRHGAAGWTGATPAESIDIAATLEAILASARTGAAIEVPAATYSA